MLKSLTIYQSSDTASKQKPQRRKMLVRASTEALPVLRLTQRDIAIINACYDYRALETSQIQQLFFNQSNSKGQLVQCQYRLKLLYHHGYLYRDEHPTKLSEGRRPLIYFLDRKGAQFLAECLDVPVTDLDWRPKHNAAGARHLFLDHLLKTNDVRIAITLAAGQEQFILERWVDDKTLKSNQMKEYVTLQAEEGDSERSAIIPDGYFQLRRGDRHNHHFLEIDLRTMTGLSSKSGHRDWSKKIRTYLIYHQNGQFQNRYNAQSFRVLTVTTGDRRLQHLKKITEEVGGKSRFWFTTFQQLTPQTSLRQPIWQIAGREGQFSLISSE